MALRDHLKPQMLINGNFQVEVTNMSVTFESGAQRVDTMDGLVGKTPGSHSLQITGNWAVPAGGLEFDFITACRLGTYVDIQMTLGAKSVISRGWFQDAGFSGGVNANSEATMTFIGSFNEPE